MTTYDFPTAYARLQSVTGTRTQVELADILGIRQSSISDAKKRGEIPAGWLLTVLKAYCVNPEWIVSGEGAQYLAGTDEQPVDEIRVRWQEFTDSVNSIFDQARQDIFQAVRKASGEQEAGEENRV